MRYVLAALLLPAVCLLPALAQDNDGEKLYREIEKKIKSATAIQVASELRMEGGPGGMMETFTASLVLTKDNKARLKLSGSAGGKEVNMEIASDGKQLRASMTFPPETKEQPLPKNFHNTVSAMVSRIGLVSGFFFANKGGDGMETDVEKLLPITEFKLEPAEKVNGKDAKVVSYNASPEGKTPARVTLWVDAKTLLPLKRLIVLGKGGERFSETYNEFTLNPKKIDLNFTFTAKKIVVDPALEAIVSGTVTYKGKPVPDSYIDFYPAEGQLRGGETDAAGNYTVKGLTAGAYRVVVNSSKVPALYRDRDTTSLRVTLMKGANIFNIELK